MKKYIISKKEYVVETSERLLEQVKAENAHTKDLSLQDYMDNVAAKTINAMTKHNIPLPAKADDIIEIWKKIGIATEQ